jgi:hypothetical protein
VQAGNQSSDKELFGSGVFSMFLDNTMVSVILCY